MLPLKGAEIADYTLASHSPTVQAELAALAQLAFSFEMDGFRGAPNNRPHNTHRSRSVSLSPTQDTNTNTVSECHSNGLNTLRVVTFSGMVSRMPLSSPNWPPLVEFRPTLFFLRIPIVL
jgi:hypothetical protein